jgi:hypothetical protein
MCVETELDAVIHDSSRDLLDRHSLNCGPICHELKRVSETAFGLHAHHSLGSQ